MDDLFSTEHSSEDENDHEPNKVQWESEGSGNSDLEFWSIEQYTEVEVQLSESSFLHGFPIRMREYEGQPTINKAKDDIVPLSILKNYHSLHTCTNPKMSKQSTINDSDFEGIPAGHLR